jgi:hypothetical protein
MNYHNTTDEVTFGGEGNELLNASTKTNNKITTHLKIIL